MATYFVRRPKDEGKRLLLQGLVKAYNLVAHEVAEIITDPKDDQILGPILDSLAEHVIRPEDGVAYSVTAPAIDPRLAEKLDSIRQHLNTMQKTEASQPADDSADQVDQVLDEMFPASETKAPEIYSRGLQKTPLSEIPVSAEQLSAIGGTVDKDGIVIIVEPADGKKTRGRHKPVEARPCKECETPTDKRSGYCSNKCYQKAYQRKLKAEKVDKTPEPERHPANIEKREPENQPAKTEANVLAILGFEPHVEHHGAIKGKRLG